MPAKQNPSSDILSEDPDGGRPDLIDAFVTRNREALNTSLFNARLELEQNGQTGQTVDGIIAAGLKRYDPSAADAGNASIPNQIVILGPGA